MPVDHVSGGFWAFGGALVGLMDFGEISILDNQGNAYVISLK